MAETSGRPKGSTQGHEHEKRSREYSFKSGGTVQSIRHSGAKPGAGTEGYSAKSGGGR